MIVGLVEILTFDKITTFTKKSRFFFKKVYNSN